MKMVGGGAPEPRQQRILALRPYAVKTQQVLADITRSVGEVAEGDGVVIDPIALEQPLLGRRSARHVLLLVITSDRGLCGAFNGNIGKAAMQAWREAEAQGQRSLSIATIGRRGRDFLRRRGAPTVYDFPGIWDRLGVESAREVARVLLDPFLAGEVDSIRIVYNEFKSAMSQRVVNEALLPVTPLPGGEGPAATPQEFIFEPDRAALLARLAPMYVEISVLRALYESMASELGARMTAMDAATKNAEEMIGKLTLQYNRARQSAITTELMEIIGGANALQEG
jgi:F-type H+-transporting ATPase subunit gamma